MYRAVLATAALFSAACACSPAPIESTTSTPEVTVLPEKATGFITANPLPLGGDWKEDVRRDDYGRPFEYALLGEKLPAFTGTLLDGTAFDSQALANWTVIDVWGIWCGDCVEDGPYVSALATAIAQDPDLDFLSIHTPASAARITPEEMFGKYGSVEAYFSSKGYNYPTLVAPDTSIREALRITWTPSYLLVAPDGTVKGYRSEFYAAEGEPVKDFLKDIARVKAESKKTALDGLSIGPAGIPGLASPTVFTLDAVQASFPGQQVVTTQVKAGGDLYPAFEVRDGADTLFTLTPGWSLGQIERISTRSPLIAGPAGERIGTSTLSGLSPADRAECVAGEGDYAGALLCPSAGTPALQLVFTAPEKGGPPETLSEMVYLVPDTTVSE
ncbi:MAG: redoxin family protein [Hyphomonas sp.]|uniref:redoxin family protein n=1 Tax=Hyphomonas sp. TaxID=87 RepID=UPI003526FF0D